MTELRTARLVMRRWQEQDKAPFALLNADPHVMRFFPSTLTAEQSDAFVARIEEHFDRHGFGLWALEVDGEFIGFTGLQWTDGLPFSPNLEVGWRLVQRAWGHGYATEAAAAAVAFGLQREPEVVSFTAVSNEPSWRVMERVGMHRTGTFDHPRVDEGSPLRRHYLYRTP
jgi:ribosomal-protein-alanine N-acetyltransferase